MKIAMITPNYGYLERGAEVFTRNISNILIKHGYDVDIYGMGYGNNIRHVDGIRIDRGIGDKWKKFITKSRMEALFKKFIGIEPDISHYSFCRNIRLADDYDILWNNGEMLGAIFCHRARKKHGIPFISTFHGNESMMMIAEAMLKPDLYAVLTPRYKKFLNDKVKGNIKVIPNGVDLQIFSPDKKPLDKYSIGELERPMFLSTSALTAKKRVHLIIEAISKIDGSLVITHDGPERDKILDMAEKKLKGRYSYTGVIPHNELPHLYNACDVYVNASRSEGHSLAMLEAMACGMPVVSHDDENRRWTAGGAGILVDVINVNKLAESLRNAANRKWNNIPRRQAEKFSWSRTVDKYENAITSILSENRV